MGNEHMLQKPLNKSKTRYSTVQYALWWLLTVMKIVALQWMEMTTSEMK